MPRSPSAWQILRVHGGKPKYYHALIGGNFRIDELQAAVLNVKLQHLDAWTRRRGSATPPSTTRAFARARLGAAVQHAAGLAGRAAHLQPVCDPRARARSRCAQHLAAAGVGTEIYYPVPLHLQQCFAYLGHKPATFRTPSRPRRETLALPIYPELTETQLQYVVDTIAVCYRG